MLKLSLLLGMVHQKLNKNQKNRPRYELKQISRKNKISKSKINYRLELNITLICIKELNARLIEGI